MQQAGNFRITAAVVATALFMQNIDSTVVATALPAMARTMNANPVHLSAAITSYLVALTVFIPISGWVADRYGARRVFMWAISIFTLASFLCAISQGLGELIAARIFQGMGGAMMVPVGRLLLLRNVRREDLVSATTWLTMPAMLGPLLGPPLGGFLTDHFSWQSVFWINLPVGVIGLLLVRRFIPPVESTKPPKPDLKGMMLMGVALCSLMIGVESSGRGIMPVGIPECAIVVGLLMSWATVRHCAKVDHPAIDFSLLSIPTFRATSTGGTLFRVGAGALPFLVPMVLQLGFGLSASSSGMISFASALGSFCMRSMTKFALRFFRVRSILIWGSVSFTIMLAACATITSSWPASAIFALLLVGGLTRSLNFACMGALAFADVPKEKLSAATSFQGTAQQMPKAVGVTIAAGAIQLSMLAAGVDHPEHRDFAVAFLVTAALVLASVPMFAKLPPDAGAGISGGSRRKAAGAMPAAHAPTSRE